VPEVFTQFRKQVEKSSAVYDPMDPLGQLPPLPSSLEPGILTSLDQLDLAAPELDDRGVLPFHGGETAGLARLRDYIWEAGCLKAYKQTRNGMLGANYSSKFSAWLALGCLSPRRVYQAVQHY